MRTLTIIVLLYFTSSVTGQNKIDTTISKFTLDSLKMEIHSLRSRNNNLYWQNLLANGLYKMDTTFLSRDSITFDYLSKTGRLIKKERLKYNKENCKTYSKEEYYDKNEQLVYVEYWNFNCSKEINPDPNDYIISEYLSRYDRFRYDTTGRLILEVIHLSTPLTLRTEYQYKDIIRQASSRKRIEENEFWNW